MKNILLQKVRYQSRSRWFHEIQLTVLVWVIFVVCRHALLLAHATGFSLNKDFVLSTPFFTYGFDYLIVACALAVAGIGHLARADARADKVVVEPLTDLIRCVDAAAAGDLTAKPTDVGSGELARLSQSISRLVSVLSRSKDLIYQLDTLVANSSEAIISLNPEGLITSWNKGAQQIFGYSTAEVKGKSIAMVSPGDQGSEIFRHLSMILQGQRTPPFEAEPVASNGRTVKALVRMSPIFDSTRQVIGVSFCAQDLSATGLRPSGAVPRENVIE